MAKLKSCADLGCASVEISKTCSFPADPDIAGIGVVLSFFISVTLSFLFALYGFYFIRSSFITNQLNKLDMVITGPINALIQSVSKSDRPLITREVFREVILMFSDQQLIVGLAILTVGFYKVKSITEYHFAVVSDLSGMALVVQFVACDILGEVVGERPEMVWWRVTAFVVLAVLSTITLIPWGNRYYLETFGAEMSCLWNRTSGNYLPGQSAQMAVYMALSFWGIVEVLSQYFPVISNNRLVRAARDQMVRWMLWPRQQYLSMQHSTNLSIASRIIRHAFHGLTFFIFILAELLKAQALSLVRNWGLLLVNVIEVFELRSLASEYGREGNEDAWGFGQAVPMFMLILPLCTLFELYWDGYFQRKLAKKPTNDHIGLDIAQAGSLATSLVIPRRDWSSFNSSHQRLVAPSPHRSRSVSPALHQSALVAPALSLADDTNHGNYYFSYPACKMGSTDFEDQLYDNSSFRMMMRIVMTMIFVGASVAACAGWTV